MRGLPTEIDILTGLEHYLAGSTPTVIPTTQQGFLRVQEKIKNPETSVRVLDSRRRSAGFYTSVMGAALGLESLAISLEPLNRSGYTLNLPQALSLVTPEGQLSPFPEDLVAGRDITREMYELLLNVNSTPELLKRLLRNRLAY